MSQRARPPRSRLRARYAGTPAGQLDAERVVDLQAAALRSVASRCRRAWHRAVDADATAVERFQGARATHWVPRVLARVTSRRLHEDVSLLMLLPLTAAFLIVGPRALWPLWLCYGTTELMRRLIRADPPFIALAPRVRPLTGVDRPLGAAPRSSLVFAAMLAFLLTRAPGLHPLWKAAAWLFAAVLALSRVLAGQIFLRHLALTAAVAAAALPAFTAAGDAFHDGTSSRFRFLVACVGGPLSFTVHLLRIEENRSRLVGTTHGEFIAVLSAIMGSDGPAGATFLRDSDEDEDEGEETGVSGASGASGAAADHSNRAATLRILQRVARQERSAQPPRPLRRPPGVRPPRDSFAHLMRSLERRAGVGEGDRSRAGRAGDVDLVPGL